MGALSANTLFHFTKTKENLISILQNGFYPRYCLEDPFFSTDAALAFPMVCFCDIPLSQIQNHSGEYGEYALGLTKEWAKNNGVCPILYTHQASNFHKSIANHINSIINMCMRQDKIKGDYMEELFRHLYSIVSYIKPYEKVKDEKYTRYYDEREWRYSINLDVQDYPSNIFLSKSDFDNSAKKNAANEKMIQYKLDFEPKNINYIIVPTDSEALEIMDNVRKIKGNFPYDDVLLLTTRIISMERIKEDF